MTFTQKLHPLSTWPTLVAILFVASSASASTFNVTSEQCTGPNSIIEAIDKANASAGEDTVSIQPGLTIRFDTCPKEKDQQFFAVNVQESVIFEGNGATLKGQQSWVSLSGVINPQGCPSEITGVIVTRTTPGFLLIGDKGADNSAIDVQVNDLTANYISAFARVYEGAQLALSNVHLIDIQDAMDNCARDAVEGYPGSSISFVDSTVENFKNYGIQLAKNIFNAALSTFGGSLYVKNSRFSKRFSGSGGAIYADSSDVTIVSSWFLRAGGFSFIGSADTPTQASIVNSVIQVDGTSNQFDRVYSAFYSNVDIQASTIVSDFGACGTCPPDDSNSMPLYADGGVFNLSETAIGVWGDFIPGGLLFAERGGRYTADPLTYIQPIDGQDAASLRALTGQPALLTDPPALPGDATGLSLTPAGRVEFVTPIVPGVLIDKVQDAGAGGSNQLRDPFDNSVITKDIFGNDRVDANGNRNIGAVQLALAPSLHAASGDAAITLEWTRPQEPSVGSIQGYDLCSSAAGVPCPYWLPASLDPDGLTLTVTQINDGSNLVNGNPYDFIVRARYGPPLTGPFGPESNLVTETPLGALAAPVLTAVPGDGEVTLIWTEPTDGGGHGILDYDVSYRLAGSVAWSPWPAGADSLQTKQTTVTGLTNGVEWEFGIRAITTDLLISDRATALATPWPVPSLSYANPVTVFENSIVSISPNAAGISRTPLFLLNGGSLPDGLQLDNATGQISGEPPAASAGSYSVTVLLTQAGLPDVFNVMANVQIQVIAPTEDLYLHYPDIDVAAGTEPLDVTPTVTGTQGGTLSYAMVPGDILPADLVLDSATGQITGVPTTATDGFKGLSVEVTETGEPSRLAVSPLIIRIQPTLSYDPVDAEVGDPATSSPIVSPSAVPGTFSIGASVLPSGISFDPATGVISGTPEVAQFEILEITFTTTGGQTQQVSAQLLISVTDYTIEFSYPQQSFAIGQPFSLLPTVSGTKGPVSFIPDNLPSGVALDPDSGEISGIMTSALANQVIPISLTDSYNTQRTLAVLEGVLPIPTAVPVLNPYGMLVMVLLALGFGFWTQRRG